MCECESGSEEINISTVQLILKTPCLKFSLIVPSPKPHLRFIPLLLDLELTIYNENKLDFGFY